MRTQVSVLLTLGAAIWLSRSVMGQGVILQNDSQVMEVLLLNRFVQEELKISPELRGKLTKVHEKYQQDMAKINQIQPESRRFGPMQAMNKRLGDDIKKTVGTSLSPLQSKRLKELDLQQRGLNDAKVHQMLRLNAEQIVQLKRIYAKLAQDTFNTIRASGDNAREANERVRALRKEALEQALGVLITSQRKTWLDLTGERFDFD